MRGRVPAVFAGVGVQVRDELMMRARTLALPSCPPSPPLPFLLSPVFRMCAGGARIPAKRLERLASRSLLLRGACQLAVKTISPRNLFPPPPPLTQPLSPSRLYSSRAPRLVPRPCACSFFASSVHSSCFSRLCVGGLVFVAREAVLPLVLASFASAPNLRRAFPPHLPFDSLITLPCDPIVGAVPCSLAFCFI